VTLPYVPNVLVDFNNPIFHRGVLVPDHDGEIEVGDKIRLIDADPGAGFMLAAVTKIVSRGYKMRSKVFKYSEVLIKESGPFVAWEDTGI